MTDHKPFEWLAIVSDTYERKGKWNNMLQDFSFKIMHHPSFKHIIIDASSRNLVDDVDDDDFQKEIQDCEQIHPLCDMDEMFWTSKKSSKIGIFLQQLGNKKLIN